MIAAARTDLDRKVFLACLIGLIGVAWAALWAWGESPYDRYLSHHLLAEVRGGGPLVLVFVGGWTLMTVAMMLPTSLPLVMTFWRVVARRADRVRLMALLLAGYLGTWTLFGGLVYLGDAALHEVVHRIPWLAANAGFIAAGTLLLAGLYQFTPLKYHCLEKCRSPFRFVTEHWRGTHESAQALWLGVHHGLFCLGCCWSLMLVMFAVGIANLGWMLVLGAMMATEKNHPMGRRLTAPLGVGLLLWGAALLLTAGPHVPTDRILGI